MLEVCLFANNKKIKINKEAIKNIDEKGGCEIIVENIKNDKSRQIAEEALKMIKKVWNDDKLYAYII